MSKDNNKKLESPSKYKSYVFKIRYDNKLIMDYIEREKAKGKSVNQIVKDAILKDIYGQ